MKINYLSIYLLFVLSLVLFTSCEKESIDDTVIEMEEALPLEVLCDMTASIGIDSLPVGVLYAEVFQGTAPFEYNWSTGDSTSSIAWSSMIDTYGLTVTDVEGCTAEAEYIVPIDPCEGFIALLETFPSGPLSASATGGTTPYSYMWSTGAQTQEIEILTDGVYSVSVTDSEGCLTIASLFIMVSDPCSSLSTSIEPDFSGGLTAITIGGTVPYIYEWSDGQFSNPAEIGLDSIYFVTVTDANGCFVVDEINLNDPCSPMSVVIVEEPPLSGSLFASANGGTAPYEYSWSNGLVSFAIMTNAPGTYSVTATDLNGCTATDNILIQ